MSNSANWSLVATRYMTAVGTTVALYEHSLLFDREIRLVWTQQWTPLQITIMVNRYCTEVVMIYTAYVLSGLAPVLTIAMCRAFIIFVGIFGTVSEGITQIALLIRVYALWDNRKEIKYMLMGGFAICYGTSLAFALVTLSEFAFTGRVFVTPPPSPLESCGLTQKPIFMTGVWGGMIVYDIYVFSMILANALYKPRRHDFEIISNLNKNNAMYFFCLFVLRIAKLFPSIFGGAAQTFLTPFVTWALDEIILFRIYLGVQELETATKETRMRFGRPRPRRVPGSNAAELSGAQPMAVQLQIEMESIGDSDPKRY